MPDTSKPFTLFTSLRFDPDLPSGLDADNIADHNPYYLLDFHRERLVAAATYFNWPDDCLTLLDPVNFRDTLDAALWKCRYHVDIYITPLKVKVILSRDSAGITLQCSPVPNVDMACLYPSVMPQPDNSAPWRLVLDDRPTAATDWTANKTSVREVYDEARERAGLKGWTEPREVVLWNSNDEVMEGSFTNIYIKRGRDWVTPAAESGGLCGTARRWLLEEGIVQEGVLMKEDIKAGDWAVLSNGVRGVWGAWVERQRKGKEVMVE